MESSSCHRQNPAHSTNVKRDWKKPLLSGCGGHLEKPMVDRQRSTSRALRTSSSSKNIPIETPQTLHRSNSRVSWSKGLLELKGSCRSCKGVRTLEEFKLSKKAYLAISTERQITPVSNTKIPEMIQENISGHLESFSQKACQISKNDLFLHNDRRDEALAANLPLPAGENMAIQVYNPHNTISRSLADHNELAGQSQEAVVLDRTVIVSSLENFEAVHQNASDGNFAETRPLLSEMQENKRFAGSGSHMGRMNPVGTVREDRLTSEYGTPPIVSHSAEISFPSSLSCSGSLNFEDRWEVGSLSDVQCLSDDSQTCKRDLSRIPNQGTENQKVLLCDARYFHRKSTLVKDEHTLVSDSSSNPSKAQFNYVTTLFQDDRVISSKRNFDSESHTSYQSRASVESSPAAVFHSPVTDAGRRSFHTDPGSRLSPEMFCSWSPVTRNRMLPCTDRMASGFVRKRMIPYTTGSKRCNSWPTSHDDEMLAIRASNRGAVRKLDDSFGECGSSLGLHKSTKELDEHAEVEAARFEGCPSRSPIKSWKTSAEEIRMSVLGSRDLFEATEFSGYTSLKAVKCAEKSMILQDNSKSPVPVNSSLDVTSRNAASSLKCRDMLGIMAGDLSPIKLIDLDTIAIRSFRQASQYSCPLPALRPPLHNLLKSLTLPTKSDSAEHVGSFGLVHGQLECIPTEETLSFRFSVASTKETLIAETSKGANVSKKGAGVPLFTFFSWTEKAKEKTGWKQWGKKPRHSVSIIGEMQVTAGGKCEVDCHGKPLLHSELQFVLLGAASNKPSSHILDGKKFNSGHMSTDPSGFIPQSISCPNSPGLGFSSQGGNLPKDLSVKDVSGVQIDNKGFRSRSRRSGLSKPVGNLSRQLSLEKSGKDCENFVKDAVDEKVQVDFATQQKTELSAMVIRLPAYPKSRWGWDINFLREDPRSVGLKDLPQKLAVCSEMLFRDDYHQENICELNSSKAVNTHCKRDQVEFEKGPQEYHLSKVLEYDLVLRDLERFRRVNDEYVTIILPAGEHGCPTMGLEGPSPLIQRWKSDGKCDCGSWDLGCGLVILSNELSCRLTKPMQTIDSPMKRNGEQSGPVEVFIQGRKQKVIAMSLSHLHGGLFSLSFQEPMSSLQAFGAAVAIVYSRLKHNILSKDKHKFKSVKLKPPRVPLRTLGTSNLVIEASPRRYKAYSRGCHPDPPLNPVDRV